MKRFTKHVKNEKGLTLIELLAVIVILAIIAAIAVPAIGNVITNSRDKAVLADASNILAGAKIAAVDGSCGPVASTGDVTCTSTQLADYIEGISGTPAPTFEAKKVSNVWTVTYSKLTGISEKNKTKFSPVGASTSTTEADLNAALQK